MCDILSHEHSLNSDRVRQLLVVGSFEAVGLGRRLYVNVIAAKRGRQAPVGVLIKEEAPDFVGRGHSGDGLGFRITAMPAPILCASIPSAANTRSGRAASRKASISS